MDIKIIYDNTSKSSQLIADWGFSCLLENEETSVLFDTGAKGALLLDNMEIMGLDTQKIDTVFISHNHWDHTGGLEHILKLNPELTLYHLPGLNPDFNSYPGLKTFEITQPTPLQITPQIYTTGLLEGKINEQALIVKGSQGMAIVTGCAHPGIAKFIQFVDNHFPDDIIAVLGGFHLAQLPRREIVEIINTFRKYDVKFAGPTHCSGIDARKLFSKEYGDNFLSLGVGVTIDIDKLG